MFECISVWLLLFAMVLTALAVVFFQVVPVLTYLFVVLTAFVLLMLLYTLFDVPDTKTARSVAQQSVQLAA